MIKVSNKGGSCSPKREEKLLVNKLQTNFGMTLKEG